MKTFKEGKSLINEKKPELIQNISSQSHKKDKTLPKFENTFIRKNLKRNFKIKFLKQRINETTDDATNFIDITLKQMQIKRKIDH